MRLIFLLNWFGVGTLSLLLKLSSTKSGPWFNEVFPEIALHQHKSIIQPCMEYFIMSGLVLLTAT